MADKPVFKPEWATDDAILPEAGTDNKIRPTEELRLTGYDYKQKPTAQELNWILNNIFEWVDYLETTTDAIGITDIASQAEAEAGAINTALMTPLRVKQYSDQYGVGGSKRLTGNNMNDLVKSGFYYVSSALNLPSGNTEGHVIVTGTGVDGEVMQRFTSSELDAGNSYQNSFRIRPASGVWGDWYQVMTGVANTVDSVSTNDQSFLGHSHELDLDSFFDNSNTANTQLIAGDGYQKLPGGLIIQWGVVPSVPADGSKTGTFPIPFPTAGLVINATPKEDFFTTTTDAGCSAIITSNANFRVRNGYGHSARNVQWFAIGY